MDLMGLSSHMIDSGQIVLSRRREPIPPMFFFALSPATAGYFYDTFAYEICFYGIYFYRISFYGIYFYKATKFSSFDCTDVRNT